MTSREEVAEVVRGIVQEVLQIDPGELTETSTLNDDLGVASLELLEVVFDVEERFGLRIPDDALRSLETGTTLEEAIDLLHAEIVRQSAEV